MNRPVCFALACCVSVLVGWARPAGAQSRFAGRVLDAESGAPIEGAVVHAAGSNTLTLSDATGRFLLRTTTPVTHLIASRLGFRADTLTGSGSELVFRLHNAVLAIDPVLIAAERSFSVASSALLRELDIMLRPRDSSQRLLSLTPGLVIAQHAGGGKAEQIFLRGFDADHGTDVSINIDGVPVNMVSHAHGQGYADLHFLLPEVVEQVETRKGSFDARDGDFATAGAVYFRTRDRVDAATLIGRVGSFGTRQTILLTPFGSATGSGGYIAGSWQGSDGPFESPQNHQRGNLFAKWTAPLGAARISASLSGFDAQWNASGQVPQRAIDSRLISRFGALDSLEGGHTSRYDAIVQIRSRKDAATRWEAIAYATRYRFRLFSDFTFFLNDPIGGDGIEQVDRRTLAGGRVELNTERKLLGMSGTLSAGADVRNDWADVALHNQNERVRRSTRTDDRIRQTHLGSWLKQDLQLSARTRVQLGVHADAFRFDVQDRLEDARGDVPHGSATRWAGLLSPRASIASNIADGTPLFASAGFGFHSNDARDVARATPEDRILPRSRSAELGARHTWNTGSIGLAGWLTDLQSELVFVGDEGTTEASGATRRLGIDAEARLRLLAWLWADADLNLSRGRLRNAPEGENLIPLAPTLTSTGGLLARHGSVSGGLRYRLIGERAADETNSVRARESHVWETFASWDRGPFRFGLSIDNVFDVEWNEAQFATTSRLRGEAQPTTELHFTPGAPRSIVFSAQVRF